MVFHDFRFPTHLLKSSKTASRTASEAAKLSSKCLSCHYHAPSWHYHDPSWGHHVAILPLLFALLSPTCPNTSEKHSPRANIVQDSPEDASDTSSKPPKNAKNQRKPKVFKCFSLSHPSPKILEKILPELPQKLPSWAQNAHLAAIMPHIGTFMTHLGAITSPSCPCCSPSCRQHVQKTSEKHNPRANIVQDSPQDAQTPLPSLPKVPKTKENTRFLSMFFAFPPIS